MLVRSVWVIEHMCGAFVCVCVRGHVCGSKGVQGFLGGGFCWQLSGYSSPIAPRHLFTKCVLHQSRPDPTTVCFDTRLRGRP